MADRVIATTPDLEHGAKSATKAAGWSRQRPRRSRTFHLVVILSLMALVGVAYYIEFTPLANLPVFQILVVKPGALLRPMFLRTIFFTLVVYAAFVFRVRGGILASIAFIALVVPRALIYPITPTSDPLIRPFVFIIIAGYVGLLVATTLNRIDREHANLQHFLAETMNTQEREKQYLARELHDDSLQQLVDISHQIDELSDKEERDNARQGLTQLRGRVDGVLNSIRQFVVGLRPPLLEEMGLESSLKWLGQELAEEKDLQVTVDVKGDASRLSQPVELSLFRIAQEALQNARKHSRATAISLKLDISDRKARVTVRDNGVGFIVLREEELATRHKFGLIGMAERSRMLEGSFRVESAPGKGTLILAEIPIGGAGKSGPA